MKTVGFLACAVGASVLSSFLCLGSARATTIDVSAQSDIFLAGQSSLPSPDFVGGAGQLPSFVSVAAGETLTITATGTINYAPTLTSGPDGLGGSSNISGYGNVGPYTGSEEGLVGVYLGPGVTTPSNIFFIGSSYSGVVPTGASTLYLGIVDSFGSSGPAGYYDDNFGSFSVDLSLSAPAPVPGAGLYALTFLILAVGASVKAHSFGRS